MALHGAGPLRSRRKPPDVTSSVISALRRPTTRGRRRLSGPGAGRGRGRAGPPAFRRGPLGARMRGPGPVSTAVPGPGLSLGPSVPGGRCGCSGKIRHRVALCARPPPRSGRCLRLQMCGSGSGSSQAGARHWAGAGLTLGSDPACDFPPGLWPGPRCCSLQKEDGLSPSDVLSPGNVWAPGRTGNGKEGQPPRTGELRRLGRRNLGMGEEEAAGSPPGTLSRQFEAAVVPLCCLVCILGVTEDVAQTFLPPQCSWVTPALPCRDCIRCQIPGWSSW